MTVLVDSNVLIDILQPNPAWAEWSREAVAWAGTSERLVINAIVYAEISVGYPTIEEVEHVLPGAADLEREPIPYEAAFAAGRAFADYRTRGGTRRSPLPDFFIGAHAAVRGYTLLTRDAVRYRSYFPRLALIAPD